MKIEHIAIWVKNLELIRDFYCKYFNMVSNNLYHNKSKNFKSYFLSFPESETRIEIMQCPEVPDSAITEFSRGLTHLAFSVGNQAEVERLTENLREDGYRIAGGPRITGDGYYESVILDPEGNRIEITG